MALFPVQGIMDGDFVVLLVPIDDGDPMTVVAEKISYHAVERRVARRPGRMQVQHNGRVLADTDTVVTAGVGPLDVLRVGYA
jgi:toluene monooxygenase system protein B